MSEIEITPEMEDAAERELERQLFDYGEEWEDAKYVIGRLDFNAVYRAMEAARRISGNAE